MLLFAWVTAGLIGGFLVNYFADLLPNKRRLSWPLWWPADRKSLLKSPRVVLVQLFYLGAAIFIWRNSPNDFPSYLFFIILFYFGLVAVIDIEHRLVLHTLSIGGAVIMGAIGIWRHGAPSTILGAAVGFTLMVVLYFAGDLLGRGVARLRGESWGETALGFGDVNLATVIGLLMGWPGVLVALVAGIALAGLYSLGFILFSMLKGNYKVFASIPYAPFLCIGAVSVVAMKIFS